MRLLGRTALRRSRHTGRPGALSCRIMYGFDWAGSMGSDDGPDSEELMSTIGLWTRTSRWNTDAQGS